MANMLVRPLTLSRRVGLVPLGWVLPLPFETELARMSEDGLAVALHVLVEPDPPALANIISSVALRF